ncbi:MAG TPA: NAD-dependent protein deacetylase [Gammaproteobacteria bacterium]|nr:NAD-dependent protein deacetylase [Gammaproteobacteria bacterium]
MTVAQAAAPAGETDADRLAAWFEGRARVVALTGAGCSTESGIPDYRDEQGAWKRKPPVQLRDFVTSEPARRRYWARALLGWRRFAGAGPNGAHRALAALEAGGRLVHLITQNVDGLHQRAGNRHVTDLHGRLDEVECLCCGARLPRAAFQSELEDRNPQWQRWSAGMAPDGDADLEGVDFSAFRIPDCAVCGGLLKPAVVFFGEAIPAERSRQALAMVETADALLVAGSSLMVWSGFRLVRAAAEKGLPVAAVNRGRTRADHLLQLKIEGACADTLSQTASRLGL